MWKQYISHFYFIILLEIISCCQCNKSHTTPCIKHKVNETDLFAEKISTVLEDYTTTEFVIENMTDTLIETTGVTINEKNIYYNENTSDLIESNSEILENSIDANTSSEVTEMSVITNEFNSGPVNETTTEVIEVKQKKLKTNKIKPSNRDLAKKCRHFKKGTAFDLNKMADVWQVVYYRLPNKLKCFKIHIKLVKNKEQQRYAKLYGSFNNTVYWNACNLEIKTSDKAETGVRRHFLQGGASEKGVMENIIIDEEHCQNTTYLTLHRESADQWLVIKNLLVMRDCDSGDLVVFTRVPLEPRRDDILDALMLFGENKPNGTMACEGNSGRTWLKYDEGVISQPLS